jgi:hypothetical protein
MTITNSAIINVSEVNLIVNHDLVLQSDVVTQDSVQTNVVKIVQVSIIQRFFL